MVGAGDLDSNPCVCQQVPYWLNHLPSPNLSFTWLFSPHIRVNENDYITSIAEETVPAEGRWMTSPSLLPLSSRAGVEHKSSQQRARILLSLSPEHLWVRIRHGEAFYQPSKDAVERATPGETHACDVQPRLSLTAPFSVSPAPHRCCHTGNRRDHMWPLSP